MADIFEGRERLEAARRGALRAYSLLFSATCGGTGTAVGERESLMLASEELQATLSTVLALRGKTVRLVEAELEEPRRLSPAETARLANLPPVTPPVSLSELDEGRAWIPPAKPRQGTLVPARPSVEG